MKYLAPFILAIFFLGCGGSSHTQAQDSFTGLQHLWNCVNKDYQKVCVLKIEKAVPNPEQLIPPDCDISDSSQVVPWTSGQTGWVTALVVYCG